MSPWFKYLQDEEKDRELRRKKVEADTVITTCKPGEHPLYESHVPVHAVDPFETPHTPRRLKGI